MRIVVAKFYQAARSMPSVGAAQGDDDPLLHPPPLEDEASFNSGVLDRLLDAMAQVLDRCQGNKER